MNRFLACLALCASLYASAQDDNCTVLGIQDLTQMVLQLQTQLENQNAVMTELQAQIENQNTAMTRDSVIAIAIHKELSIDEVTGGDLSTINLFGSDLSGADLESANLSWANLGYVTLNGADLSGADLISANLIGANLSGADLSYANLSGANLSGANLSGAIMTCLQVGCPSALPSGYICEPDTDCSEPARYRIVVE